MRTLSLWLTGVIVLTVIAFLSVFQPVTFTARKNPTDAEQYLRPLFVSNFNPHSKPGYSIPNARVYFYAPTHALKLGLDLQGGMRVVLQIPDRGEFSYPVVDSVKLTKLQATKKKVERTDAARGIAAIGIGETRRLEWRLRVVSLTTGKVVKDEPDMPGLAIRAISDSGLLVQSGVLGTDVHDVGAKPPAAPRAIDRAIDLGYRGIFRNDKELVYVNEGAVAVVAVTKD
jgi:hypothetical protein